MTGFHHAINSRIAAARENLRLAVEQDDPFLANVHVGELESLARLAADHGVEVEGLPDGLSQTAGTGPIDLRSAQVRG